MLRPKKKYRLKRFTAKTYEKKKQRSEKLSVYYDTLISRCVRSEESGEYIPNPSRMNICHIFYKRKYKSIEDDLDNYVYLESDKHATLDRLLDLLDFNQIEKEFPNSWSIICERVKRLLPKIKESGKLKSKFEEYFNETKDLNMKV